MRKVLQALGASYIVYLSFVILLVLPALNTLPHWYVQDTFGRQLHTDIVLLNPFTLNLEVRNARLPEIDGAEFLSARRAGVNLSLEGLWQAGWVLDEVVVDELYLHVKKAAAGRFNFSDMLDAIPPSEPSPEDDGSLPGLTVHELKLGAQRIELTDEAREIPFNTHYDGLAIQVAGLSTTIEEGKPYEISATAESGGTLHWIGTVSIPRSRSEGTLTLGSLSLHPVWRFAEPWLDLELKQGQLDISGDYKVSWADTLSYSIDKGELSVSGIKVAPKDPASLPDTAIALDSLSVEGIALDSSTQHIEVDSVHIARPAIAGWMEEERISLQELFAISGLPDQPEDTSPEPPSSWTARLGQARITEGEIQWRSAYTDPQQLMISPIDAHLHTLRWPLEGQSPMGLGFSINELTSVQVDGSLALGSGEGTLEYRMDELPLPWFNPNLPAALRATITDGRAGVEGQVTLAEFLPSRLKLSGAIEDFAGRIADEEDSMTSWKRVRLEDLDIDIDQKKISLAQVLINTYEGRVHIHEDGSVNASRVWQEEAGERAGELVEELDLEEKPWQFDLPGIYVSDSAIDFMDESLPIPFRTVIGGLNGEVTGISSTAGAEARVDMKGSVDGYAPVLLSGTAVPFDEPPALNLELTFNGVDLSLLTPYSGTYAGHAIDRGLLNLDLKYTLENNHLQGENNVLIDQLKLGEKIDSDKAVDLPLELAIALLTDLNGVIDIELPVSGDVNDPEFGIGSAVGKVLLNLITKAVTAPFSLLANLVGSDEDLQRLNFSSGSTQLSEGSRAKLDQLVLALEQRPALTLVIHGRLNLEADREALQIAALNEELIATGLTQDDIDDKSETYTKAIELRYRKLVPQGELPSPPNQRTVLSQSITVADSQMLELAEARSIAIKTYLVNEKGMPADRAAIDQTTMDSKAHLFSGVELALES